MISTDVTNISYNFYAHLVMILRTAELLTKKLFYLRSLRLKGHT